MNARRYQPWRKGPAVVLPFPTRWHRAWLVCLVDGSTYRGEVRGENCDGPSLTEAGSHELVIAALRRPENRRGLPIIPCCEAGQ